MVTIGATSCHKRVLKGSGREVSETRVLSSFAKIEANGSTGISVVKDSVYSVIVTGYSNLVPLYETRVNGDRLILQYEERFWNIRNDNIRIEVHTPYVDKVSLNGSGSVTVNSGFEQDNFKADLNGSGNINVKGNKYYVIDADVNGSGDIDAETSIAEESYCRVSGSGNIYVNVNKYLDVNISGSGNVYYKGNPKVKTNISGSGDVRPR